MNHSICNAIYNKVSSGTFLYWYAVVALLLPNIALCFTERLSFWAGAANVLLPLALYMWFFSVARCPGKMVWWAFFFVFFAAFQLVLLYLFGTGYVPESRDHQSGRSDGTAGQSVACRGRCFCDLSSLAHLGCHPYQEEASVIRLFPASYPQMGHGGWIHRPLLSPCLLCSGGWLPDAQSALSRQYLL